MKKNPAKRSDPHDDAGVIQKQEVNPGAFGMVGESIQSNIEGDTPQTTRMSMEEKLDEIYMAVVETLMVLHARAQAVWVLHYERPSSMRVSRRLPKLTRWWVKL
ncbi:hypothetical protein RvY_10024 [Ramazzottius varieornatus]|uniref:Uncharacterized protein n=1 Tax=Ramazzottius varieornatus TaxID=947166 RepID=A0A1D1VBE5_RAMVA|nr:hypothetical protein RvY_10024 [Ramazzottius varieornatus]